MYQYDIQKMFTNLRGFLRGASLWESEKALSYMRERHGNQTRSGGQPYIIHPLWMASYAVALGIRDDNTIATILLHDVVEDTQTRLEDLPFNETIKKGVRYMTFTMYPGEEKATAKKRYFRELLESREALVCKALDRFMNLSTMEGIMSEQSIIKNVKETDTLLLPILKEGKDKWMDLSDLLFVLRCNLRAINDTLANAHHVELTGDGASVPESYEGVEGCVEDKTLS